MCHRSLFWHRCRSARKSAMPSGMLAAHALLQQARMVLGRGIFRQGGRQHAFRTRKGNRRAGTSRRVKIAPMFVTICEAQSVTAIILARGQNYARWPEPRKHESSRTRRLYQESRPLDEIDRTWFPDKPSGEELAHLPDFFNRYCVDRPYEHRTPIGLSMSNFHEHLETVGA